MPAPRSGDGLITTSPQRRTIEAFEQAGGRGKPIYGQLTVCWADDRESAVKTALEWWPTAAIPGELRQKLPMPAHFEQVLQVVTEEMLQQAMPCGPDLDPIREKIAQYSDAGFTHSYIHQIGPNQDGFLAMCERDLLPELSRAASRA